MAINTTRVADHSPVDFLLLTTLPEEKDALLSLLDGYQKTQEPDSPVYYLAKLKLPGDTPSYQLAVCMLDHMGNVDAATSTSRAISDLKPRNILLVGIAGGIKGKVKLGDVVIADQVIYYEPGKLLFWRQEQRARSENTDRHLFSRAKNYSQADWHALLSVKRPNATNAEYPHVHFGPIACGEKVIKNPYQLSSIRKSHADLLGVEMESFGVLSAAAKAATPPRVMIIRGISDYADMKKDDTWHAYAAGSAAAFAVGFIASQPVPPVREISTSLIGDSQPEPKLVVVRHQSMQPIMEKAIAGNLPEGLKDTPIQEWVIDQTDLYANGTLVDPILAVRREVESLGRLTDVLREQPNSQLAYYGIAHIPLVFLAGFLLSNKRGTLLFDLNRDDPQKWDQLDQPGSSQLLQLSHHPGKASFPTEAILTISVSYPIAFDLVQAAVTETVPVFQLTLEHPDIRAIFSRAQIRDYAGEFRRALDEIHNQYPAVSRIHLFYAGPCSLAFEMGTRISATVHPHVLVYNYSRNDTPCYKWAIDLLQVQAVDGFYIKLPNSNQSW